MCLMASEIIYIRVSSFSSQLLLSIPFIWRSFRRARSSSQRDICTCICWNTKIFPVEKHLSTRKSHVWPTTLFKLRHTGIAGLWFCVFCNYRLHTFREDAPMLVLIHLCLKILPKINQKIRLRCQCKIVRRKWQAAYVSITRKVNQHRYLETARKMR